jgi:hypothetical protein
MTHWSGEVQILGGRVKSSTLGTGQNQHFLL